MKFGKRPVRLRPSTPKKLSDSIKAFLGLARLDPAASFLRHTAASRAYKPGYCLNNCEAESKQSGAAVVYGWMIWELRKEEFIEAEFHAVVRKDGELIDITPRADGDEWILFVPDSTRTPERVSPVSWRTWTNIKSRRGRIVERARRIVFMDPAAIAARIERSNEPLHDGDECG